MIKAIIAIFAAAVAVFALLPGIYAFRALSAYAKRDVEKSLELYEKAYKTGRASQKAKINYALVALRSGEPERAEKIFDEIIASPKAKEAVKNSAKQYRCLAYIKLDRCDEALAEARELLEKYKNSDLYAVAGYAMSLTAAPDGELLKFCEEAYDYNGDNRDIADNLAVALVRVGEYQKAVDICDEVIEGNKYFPEGHFHKARALFAMGKYADVLEELEALEDCDFKYMTTVSDEEIAELRKRAEEKMS